jgi:outer membrane protein TolC
MNLTAAALALAVLAGPAAAQKNGETVTLEAAVAAAVKNSPAALTAEQDIIIARQRVHEARFMALPQLTLSGTLSRLKLEYPAVLGTELGDRYVDPAAGNSFYSLRAQALQPLYTGGKNTNTLKLAKTAHNQAKVNFEAARADAALAAKRSFYALLYRRRAREAAAYWLARARGLAAGLPGDAFEQLEAAVLLSGLADKARQAEGEQDGARAALLKAMNREPGYAAEPDGRFEALPVEPEVSRSLVTAMESRPELKSELYKAQMDDIAVSMAMVKRYPTIYLGASYDMNAYKFSSLADSAERSGSWLASIAIHFPLSYDIWTQVQQRRAQQRQGELKRAERQDAIRFEIQSAHKEADSRQREATQLAAELAGMKAAYDAAARTARPSMSALRALCALADLEQKQLGAVYAQLLARVKLEWAQGRDFGR